MQLTVSGSGLVRAVAKGAVLCLLVGVFVVPVLVGSPPDATNDGDDDEDRGGGYAERLGLFGAVTDT